MKGALATKYPFTAKGLKFILLPSQRKFPKEKMDFDVRYIGPVRIVECTSHNVMKGKIMSAVVNLPCMESYFEYTAKQASIQVNNRSADVEIHQHYKDPLCRAQAPNNLTKAQVDELIAELNNPFVNHEEEWTKEEKKEAVAYLQKLKHPTLQDIETAPMYDMYKEKLTLVRMDALQCAYYFMAQKDVQKQKRAIEKMSYRDLSTLARQIQTTPWLLAIKAYTYKKFDIKPMTESKFYEALVAFGLKNKMPVFIKDAMCMYFELTNQRTRNGHTAFTLSGLAKQIGLTRDMAMPTKFLMHHALDTTHDDLVGIKSDVYMANCIADWTKGVYFRSMYQQPQKRIERVPIIPHQPTPDQLAILGHIDASWFTMVEGLPGTGKTCAVTWCLARYSNCLIVSFIGMMVKTLQRRCGKRKETAHTIHRIISLHRFVDQAPEWLGQFEVLVIDEVSNVEMRLLAKLVKCLPNVCKFVVVGDHEQLFPIGPGDPMGDLKRAFPLKCHRLTQVLRVNPTKRRLQDAPRLIAEGKAGEIDFCTNLAEKDNSLVMVPKCNTNKPVPGKEKDLPASEKNARVTLRLIVQNILSTTGWNPPELLSGFHIVVLQNGGSDGRKLINRAAEHVLHMAGAFPSRGPYDALTVRKGFAVWAGKKITFLKNYNHPPDAKPKPHRAFGLEIKTLGTVNNGELVTVMRATTMPSAQGGGILMQVQDLEGEEQKWLWLQRKHGIDPAHVTDGYATTTYKIQGNEFPYVVFWMNNDPSAFWTREHAYVALSRGKQQIYCCGTRTDLIKMCRQKAKPRNTMLASLLSGSKEMAQQTDPQVCQQAMACWPKVEDLKEMSKEEVCLPVLGQKKKEEPQEVMDHVFGKKKRKRK